jgi:RNA polymerase sigma-70 factor (ECF subfamily)
VIPDEDLVRRALEGRTEAYDELVRRWSGRIIATCRSVVRRADVAEELAEESLVRGYFALRSLEDPARFPGWIRGIARRVSLDWIRREKRAPALFSELGPDFSPDSLADSDGSIEEATVDDQDEIERVLSELDRLPPDCRETCLLYYAGEATYAELARVLGVAPATVNARLTKGRAILRRRLTKPRS